MNIIKISFWSPGRVLYAQAQSCLQGTATFSEAKKPISGVNMQLSGTSSDEASGTASRLGVFTLSVGSNNIFNTFPPVQDYGKTYFGIFSYSRVAPFGTRGAPWYGGIAVKI